MAEFVGGAFLHVALQVAFERLASTEMFDFFRDRKLKEDLLVKLHIILISVNQVVEDAEERQYRNPNVKKWLVELKDQVFKAEDVLDEIATEASQQKLAAEYQTATSKVRHCLTPFVNPFDKEIESRIQQVLDNLEYLIKQNEVLGLRAGVGVGTEVGVNRKLFKRSPTSSIIDESDIYGRHAEKENIIKDLQSHSGNQPLSVIVITGLGGMGKTTLARLVYDDKRMEVEFELRAWLTVSEEFDVDLIRKAILQAHGCVTKDSVGLQRTLESLEKKKIFLVLDDVWEENRTKWDALQDFFQYEAEGSKILLTTRNRNVANVLGSPHVYLLKQLQGNDCWKLFAKHAFNDQPSGIDPKLIRIGTEIVEKCGGLPLAIKTLGRLLRTKLSPQDWKKILESEIWHLSEDDSSIIPSLRLSYHYLPSNLKRCFAYCSIFPKDYEIDKDVLIQLWMAEGLLHSNQNGKSIDEVGNEIFRDLESRAFFEPSKSDDGIFVMHELVNDLAKSVMGEFYLWLESTRAQDIPIKARYFSYFGGDDHKVKQIDAISKCHQLRSFMPFQLSHFDRDIMNDLLSTLARLRYMRVLSLHDLEIQRLPNDISNLKHLRYLDLSYTGIKRLPGSICMLINLQTLKLKGCKRMTKLPSDLHKLINLCHLDLKESGIRKMPLYRGKLKYLRASIDFVVGKNGGSNLKELRILNRLRGTLVISKLENITDPKNAEKANIKEIHLDKLELCWGLNKNRGVPQHQELMLHALQPNYEVKELTVKGYRGEIFPNWFNGRCLRNVVSLDLSYCTACINNLPPLGQLPSLKRLDIYGFDGLEVIGDEFYGNDSLYTPFRSLLYLRIWNMKEWEKWNLRLEDHSFPRLQELRIENCPKLKRSLPQHLPSLDKLVIQWCKNLETSLPIASSMYINGCETLKEMLTCSPTYMGPSTSSASESRLLQPLRSLKLTDCPEIKSLPQAGLLSSLRHLTIWGCPKLIASREDWRLHNLLSLEEIAVGDHDFDNVVSFPEEGLLPPNVRSLAFYKCSKLTEINYRGLLHLQSLECLIIYQCPILSFESFPEEGLPKSLSRLQISGGCPLLEQRCQEENGQDWPKISHIPRIDISAH